MQRRPVSVSDCIWQTRLQRMGSPLLDLIEYRLLCLLRPSAPAVAVSAYRSATYAGMRKEFRRQGVLGRGDLIALTLTFRAERERRVDTYLGMEPTDETCAKKMLQYPGILWRTAAPQERPDGATVFLSPGTELLTGEILEVAAIAPSVRVGMLLVDLDDVKGLRAGRWRLRRAAALHGSIWRILATGVRIQRVVLGG